jgi:hypothetical protein
VCGALSSFKSSGRASFYHSGVLSPAGFQNSGVIGHGWLQNSGDQPGEWTIELAIQRADAAKSAFPADPGRIRRQDS